MYNNAMEIEFDPAKARTNLRRHRVSFAQAEEALHDDRAFTIEDPDAHGEQRFITLGMDILGRVLVVVYAHNGNCIRIISARKASPGEMENYNA